MKLRRSFYVNHKVETPDDARRAAQSLLDMGIKNVVITLGERRIFANAHEAFFCPVATLKNPVVDTTGAGDAFNAGLAVGLAENMVCEKPWLSRVLPQDSQPPKLGPQRLCLIVNKSKNVLAENKLSRSLHRSVTDLPKPLLTLGRKPTSLLRRVDSLLFLPQSVRHAREMLRTPKT